jgi:hypothetical protein
MIEDEAWTNMYLIADSIEFWVFLIIIGVNNIRFISIPSQRLIQLLEDIIKTKDAIINIKVREVMFLIIKECFYV